MFYLLFDDRKDYVLLIISVAHTEFTEACHSEHTAGS